MKSQTKAMETIRKKQEKAEAARRKQMEAERKGEKVEFEDIGGAKEPRTPSTIKPGKVEKVNLSHFKLKTVLGRGGYGKVRKHSVVFKKTNGCQIAGSLGRKDL